ncbi:MAG: PepSY-like domain-containing protein [Bacteroidetes bacterium]|nr:PepSY-like domain-containing protein [Bacteroidota bacterium]
MKKTMMMAAMAVLLSTGTATAQKLAQAQVPSVIVNSFQKSFAKAYDIKWEMDGSLYKVEFETGMLGDDHDAWYDATGKIVRHKEDIAQSDLPAKVSATIASQYSGYAVDDVDRVTEGSSTSYKVELKKPHDKWKVVFDSEGKVLSKIAD